MHFDPIHKSIPPRFRIPTRFDILPIWLQPRDTQPRSVGVLLSPKSSVQRPDYKKKYLDTDKGNFVKTCRYIMDIKIRDKYSNFYLYR